MPDRTPISKKLRFDVFKRDGFVCQYCGASPPSVILEIDHIAPVSSGGSNSIDNLLTSCFSCNRGKAADSLSAVPQTIVDKTEVLRERLLQVKEHEKLIKQEEKRAALAVKSVVEVYELFNPGYTANELGRRTMRTFIGKLPASSVREAMEIACSKFRGDDSRLWRYFCGICWRRIKGE